MTELTEQTSTDQNAPMNGHPRPSLRWPTSQTSEESDQSTNALPLASARPAFSTRRRRRFGRKPEAERLREYVGEVAQLQAVDVSPVEDEVPPRLSDVKRAARAARKARRMRQAAESEAMVLAAQVDADRIRHQAETEKIAHDDELWAQRAKSDADRATNLDAKIAKWKRQQAFSGRVLNFLTVIGVIWGSINVRHNIAGDLDTWDPRQLLALALEPLLMIPLLLNLQAHTARARGVEYISRRQPLRAAFVLVLELAALATIVWINVFPHLEAGEQLIIWCIPPVMVVVSVLLKPALIGHYDALIETLRPMDTGRLDDEAARVLTVMTDIEVGLATGLFDEKRLDDDGLPGVGYAQKVLGIRKAVVQQALDGLRARRRRLAETVKDQQESATNVAAVR